MFEISGNCAKYCCCQVARLFCSEVPFAVLKYPLLSWSTLFITKYPGRMKYPKYHARYPKGAYWYPIGTLISKCVFTPVYDHGRVYSPLTSHSDLDAGSWHGCSHSYFLLSHINQLNEIRTVWYGGRIHSIFNLYHNVCPLKFSYFASPATTHFWPRRSPWCSGWHTRHIPVSKHTDLLVARISRSNGGAFYPDIEYKNKRT